jgi:hypothetical protein
MKQNNILKTFLFLFCIINITFSFDSCSSRKSCLSCTESPNSRMKGWDGGSPCRWCNVGSNSNGICFNSLLEKNICNSSSNSLKIIEEEIIHWEDRCPIKQEKSPLFLSNWMGELLPVIGSYPLLHLSLPGTHDTLTYDLSTIVSDGGADDMLIFAEIMHKYADIVPEGVEDWIRQQSQTQILDIVSQLDNGIRFLDFRMMYEYSDISPDWYTLHFMEGNVPAMEYFQAIRLWIDEHPNEIVVIWVSKHGNENAVGEDQYPKTPIEAKKAYWNRILSVFDGVMTDFSITKINETTVNEMIERDQRVVVYASDYVELTSSSKYALNGNLMDNHLGPSVTDEVNALAWERDMFSQADSIKASDSKEQKLFLMSLSTGVPTEQFIDSSILRFFPEKSDEEKATKRCAASFNLEGFDWCPPTILDIANLENYYKQKSLEEALNVPGYAYPNAIYINGVTFGGTLRTGTEVLWGAKRSDDEEHAVTAYAYVDTMLAYNVRNSCSKQTKESVEFNDSCILLMDIVNKRRALNPAQYWTDSKYGRLENWPK